MLGAALLYRIDELYLRPTEGKISQIAAAQPYSENRCPLSQSQ